MVNLCEFCSKNVGLYLVRHFCKQSKLLNTRPRTVEYQRTECPWLKLWFQNCNVTFDNNSLPHQVIWNAKASWGRFDPSDSIVITWLHVCGYWKFLCRFSLSLQYCNSAALRQCLLLKRKPNLMKTTHRHQMILSIFAVSAHRRFRHLKTSSVIWSQFANRIYDVVSIAKRSSLILPSITRI